MQSSFMNLLQEQEAERRALPLLRHAHFEACLQAHHLAPSLEVTAGVRRLPFREVRWLIFVSGGGFVQVSTRRKQL